VFLRNLKDDAISEGLVAWLEENTHTGVPSSTMLSLIVATYHEASN
jgi:hypothetical protein